MSATTNQDNSKKQNNSPVSNLPPPTMAPADKTQQQQDVIANAVKAGVVSADYAKTPQGQLYILANSGQLAGADRGAQASGVDTNKLTPAQKASIYTDIVNKGSYSVSNDTPVLPGSGAEAAKNQLIAQQKAYDQQQAQARAQQAPNNPNVQAPQSGNIYQPGTPDYYRYQFQNSSYKPPTANIPANAPIDQQSGELIPPKQVVGGGTNSTKSLNDYYAENFQTKPSTPVKQEQETVQLSRDALTPDQLALVQQQEAQGYKYLGSAQVDYNKATVSLQFAKLSDLQAAGLAYKESLQNTNFIKYQANALGYDVQQSNGGITFVPRADVQQGKVVNSAGQDVTNQFLSGQVPFANRKDLTYVPAQPKPPQVQENPNIAEQVYKATVGFGANIAASTVDLVGLGESKIVELVQGKDAADKFIQSQRNVTDQVRQAGSLKGLATVYQAIGNATGSNAYKQAAQHAEEQSTVEHASIDPIQAASGGVAALVGSKAGTEVVNQFVQQTKQRPLETAITTAEDFLTFGGSGLLKGGAEETESLRFSEETPASQVKPASFDVSAPKAISEEPLRFTDAPAAFSKADYSTISLKQAPGVAPRGNGNNNAQDSVSVSIRGKPKPEDTAFKVTGEFKSPHEVDLEPIGTPKSPHENVGVTVPAKFEDLFTTKISDTATAKPAAVTSPLKTSTVTPAEAASSLKPTSIDPEADLINITNPAPPASADLTTTTDLTSSSNPLDLTNANADVSAPNGNGNGGGNGNAGGNGRGNGRGNNGQGQGDLGNHFAFGKNEKIRDVGKAPQQTPGRIRKAVDDFVKATPDQRKAMLDELRQGGKNAANGGQRQEELGLRQKILEQVTHPTQSPADIVQKITKAKPEAAPGFTNVSVDLGRGTGRVLNLKEGRVSAFKDNSGAPSKPKPKKSEDNFKESRSSGGSSLLLLEKPEEVKVEEKAEEPKTIEVPEGVTPEEEQLKITETTLGLGNSDLILNARQTAKAKARTQQGQQQVQDLLTIQTVKQGQISKTGRKVKPGQTTDLTSRLDEAVKNLQGQGESVLTGQGVSVTTTGKTTGKTKVDRVTIIDTTPKQTQPEPLFVNVGVNVGQTTKTTPTGKTTTKTVPNPVFTHIPSTDLLTTPTSIFKTVPNNKPTVPKVPGNKPTDTTPNPKNPPPPGLSSPPLPPFGGGGGDKGKGNLPEFFGQGVKLEDVNDLFIGSGAFSLKGEGFKEKDYFKGKLFDASYTEAFERAIGKPVKSNNSFNLGSMFTKSTPKKSGKGKRRK